MASTLFPRDISIKVHLISQFNYCFGYSQCKITYRHYKEAIKPLCVVCLMITIDGSSRIYMYIENYENETTFARSDVM